MQHPHRRAVERILSPLRAELGVGIEGETRNLAFPDGMVPGLRMSITRAHRDLIRLALGFDHAVDVGIDPKGSKNVLRELRKQLRAASSRALIAQIEAVFNVYKNAWTGVPIPEASALATLVSDKSFPILADLSAARQRAIEMWLASCNVAQPCNRAGLPYAGDEIYWLPPMKSIRASHPDGMFDCGAVGELKQALENA